MPLSTAKERKEAVYVTPEEPAQRKRETTLRAKEAQEPVLRRRDVTLPTIDASTPTWLTWVVVIQSILVLWLLWHVSQLQRTNRIMVSSVIGLLQKRLE